MFGPVWFREDRFEAVADQLKLSENLALSEGRKPPFYRIFKHFEISPVKKIVGTFDYFSLNQFTLRDVLAK